MADFPRLFGLFARIPRALPALLLAGLALLGACESTDEADTPVRSLDAGEEKEAEALAEKSASAFAEAEALFDGESKAPKAGEGDPGSLSKETRKSIASAIALHQEAFDRFQGFTGMDSVLFRLGRLLKMAGSLEEAHETFYEVLSHYPASKLYSEVIDEEMEIARCFLGGERRSFIGLKVLGGSSLGAEILEKVLDVAPFSRHGPEALYRLGNHALENREFEEAVVHYETLVRRFPGDLYGIKAEFQAARAFFLKFDSPPYDLTPLEESKNRFQLFIERYSENPDTQARALVGRDRGPKAGEGAERYTGARAFVAQIEDLLARKNVEIGDYYRRKGHHKAARVYYRFTFDEYPLSCHAKTAAERLKALELREEEEGDAKPGKGKGD